jgi:4-hydroxybenzoate polyprenyltransferase
MLLAARHRPPYWRTLLVLGRVSTLPTIWSHCLAGWLLGGAGPLLPCLLLLLGASCLAIAGMFLNDAFDAEFDRLHRQERPIPAGLITLDEVWQWGFGWLALGTVLLVVLGSTTGAWVALLVLCILLHDAIHKVIAFAPLLLAACRFFLYLVAASVADDGVTGLVIWSALALAGYVTGLGYLARHEDSKAAVPFWPVSLLLAPPLLALLLNSGHYRLRALFLVVLAGLWVARSVRFTYWVTDRNVSRTLRALTAGLVLVDLLAVGSGEPLAISLLFGLLFVTALLFQRFAPEA